MPQCLRLRASRSTQGDHVGARHASPSFRTGRGIPRHASACRALRPRGGWIASGPPSPDSMRASSQRHRSRILWPWLFVRAWRTCPPLEPLLARAERTKVGPGLRQGHAVRTASSRVGVLVVLPVVLPKAHVADPVEAPLGEGAESAARAPIRTGSGDDGVQSRTWLCFWWSLPAAHDHSVARVAAALLLGSWPRQARESDGRPPRIAGRRAFAARHPVFVGVTGQPSRTALAGSEARDLVVSAS